MSALTKKTFKRKISLLFSELVFSIIFGLGGILSLPRGDLVPLILILFSLFGIVDFIWGKNKPYIQITNDGMHIFPTSFIGSSKTIKWDSISKIEKIRKYKLILALYPAKTLAISLTLLNKDDRKSFLEIIEETISNKESIASNAQLHPSLEKNDDKNNDILPESVKCPHCSVELDLEDEERKSKKYTCPNCNKYVDLS
jgi:hypothetical protein